ncbi:receptor-binding cancer antigen expressed on SiSo cells isoform X2 [Ranitomeya imitator]|uniref:receptor-binding cancer antigen expressed on SiSo cells isoform X2 n=1 Tax=Ranitomeya imitator TaxID=111125 RepID=UPI0037E8AAD7
MAVTQFRLFKICTCLASILAFFKRLICRSGRGRKLSGDQITLPTTVDYSVPKQVEEWSSWDDEVPTSVKIEGGNGTLATPNSGEQQEPDYFKDMTPTIRKTQKIIVKKREPITYNIPDGSIGFSSRLAAGQDLLPYVQSAAESSRKGKTNRRAAKEEDGERRAAANEEGTEQNRREIILTMGAAHHTNTSLIFRIFPLG